jgi:hypothetical protein
MTHTLMMAVSPSGIAMTIHIFSARHGHIYPKTKCCINEIMAGVRTNAIDLHDIIVYCHINTVPGLVYL